MHVHAVVLVRLCLVPGSHLAPTLPRMPATVASIRRSGLEDEFQKRWEREMHRRQRRANGTDPFMALSLRVRNAPARWRSRVRRVIEAPARWRNRVQLVNEVFSPSESPLPEGWQELLDPDSGLTYYVDPAGASTWKRPRTLPPPALAAASSAAGNAGAPLPATRQPSDGANAPLPYGWEKYIDQDGGSTYYVGPDGVSTWTRPEAPPPVTPKDSGALSTKNDAAAERSAAKSAVGDAAGGESVKPADDDSGKPAASVYRNPTKRLVPTQPLQPSADWRKRRDPFEFRPATWSGWDNDLLGRRPPRKPGQLNKERGTRPL